MFFKQLTNILMDNFEKIIVEKKVNKVIIPISYELGSFNLFYNIEIVKSKIDESWFEVIRKVKSSTNYVGKIKKGALEDEIMFVLNDIIKQTQEQALKTANKNVNYLSNRGEDVNREKKYLYCLMDSTTSSLAGWDVEIFLDCPESRDGWINSDVGTDADELRNQLDEELSVFGFFSKKDAEKYIEKLKVIYDLTSLDDIPQINC